MTHLTGAALEGATAFVANYVWVLALIGMMYREVRRARRYPWPAWSVRLVRRFVARLSLKAEAA
jgi:hypothetical protein